MGVWVGKGRGSGSRRKYVWLGTIRGTSQNGGRRGEENDDGRER